MEDGRKDDVVHDDVGVDGAHVAEEAVFEVGEALQLVREEHGGDAEQAQKGQADRDDGRLGENRNMGIFCFHLEVKAKEIVQLIKSW